MPVIDLILTGTEKQYSQWFDDLNCWRWPSDWGDPPEWVSEKLALSGRARYERDKCRYARMCNAMERLKAPAAVAAYEQVAVDDIGYGG